MVTQCVACHCQITTENSHHYKSSLCRDCFTSGIRKCSTCQICKPLSEFHAGKSYICKACSQLRNRPGNKTCVTCGTTHRAIDFPKHSRECIECNGKRRKCSRCKGIFDLSHFHRTASGQGLRRICISCVAQLRRLEYHQRPRRCKVCGTIQTSFPSHSQVCQQCLSKFARCRACKCVKPLEDFGNDANSLNGRQGTCRACVSKADAERRELRLTRCLHCGEEKPRDQFLKNKKVCNDCRSATSQVCYVCGKEKPIEEFPEKDPKQATGRAKRCAECSRTRQVVTSKAPRGRYRSLHAAAKHGNYTCDIGFEDYCSIIRDNCHYCGSELANSGSGLDRINPLGGYTLDNVVPCCRQCNWTKSDYFTYDEMLVIGKAIGLVKSQRSHGKQSEASQDASAS